jgi:hypothetical protein
MFEVINIRNMGIGGLPVIIADAMGFLEIVAKP